MKKLLLFVALSLSAQPWYDSGNAKKIQGRAVSASAPANGNTLVYNSTTKKWEPAAGGGGYTAGSGITLPGNAITVDTAVIQSRATEQAGTTQYCRSTTGNATYTCGLTPALTAYTRGGCLVLDADFSNVTTATVDVNSLGVKSILNRAGAALAAGGITANKPITLCYDGTQYIVQGDGDVATVTDVYWPWGIANGDEVAHQPGAAVQRTWTFTPPYTVTTTKFVFQTSGTARSAWAISTFNGTAAVTNATANCDHSGGSGNALECSWAGTVTLTGGTTYRLIASADAATGWYVFNNSGFFSAVNGFAFSSTKAVGTTSATATGTGATLAIAFPLGTISTPSGASGQYPYVVFIP